MGYNVSVQRLVMGLVLISCLVPIVHGIKCYQCFKGTEGDMGDCDECEEKLKSEPRNTCADFQMYCVKKNGVARHVSAIPPTSGGPDLKTAMGRADFCKSLNDVTRSLNIRQDFDECICID